MDLKLITVLALAVALALGVAGCKSNASDTASLTAVAETGSSEQAAASDENPAGPAAEVETDAARDNNSNEPKPSQPNALPRLASKGATRVEMRNVDFHTEDAIVLRIRALQGALLRTKPSTPPVFDDKRSFALRIDSGTIGIRVDSLAALMNNYVFAYPHAPLKRISISTNGTKIKMSASMHKVVDVPVKIEGDLTATPDGKIRLHPTSIKAAGIPAKGFMHLFGLDLSEVMKANASRGVTLDDNDIIMDPERMMPPPAIRGKVTAVRVEGDEVIQVFGSGKAVAARSSSNYMSYRGGTLRFGKLTMTNADLRIIDADPKNAFDFSIDHYNRQLVAGHSKNTPDFGLVVVMPDYNKLSGEAGKGTTGR